MGNMEETLARNLLAVADVYCKARDHKLSTVGKDIADDSRFFRRLGDPNTTVTARKYDKVMRKFSDNWPAGTTWPKSVKRPTPAEAPA